MARAAPQVVEAISMSADDKPEEREGPRNGVAAMPRHKATTERGRAQRRKKNSPMVPATPPIRTGATSKSKSHGLSEKKAGGPSFSIAVDSEEETREGNNRSTRLPARPAATEITIRARKCDGVMVVKVASKTLVAGPELTAGGTQRATSFAMKAKNRPSTTIFHGKARLYQGSASVRLLLVALRLKMRNLVA